MILDGARRGGRQWRRLRGGAPGGDFIPPWLLRLIKKPYFAVFSFAARQKKCIFAIMNFTLY